MTTNVDEHVTRGSDVWRMHVSLGQQRRLARQEEARRRTAAANDPLLMREGESLADWLARTITTATSEQLDDCEELVPPLAVRGIQLACRRAMDRMVKADACPRMSRLYHDIRRDAWRMLYQDLCYLRVPAGEIRVILTAAVGEFPEASA